MIKDSVTEFYGLLFVGLTRTTNNTLFFVKLSEKTIKPITAMPYTTVPGGHRHFEDLVHSSPVAIYTCDQYGYITYFNQAASQLWGRVPEIGQDLWCGSWKIFYPDGTPMLPDECPMALTLKSGITHQGREIMIQRPDLSFRRLLVFPKPIFDIEGNLAGAHNTLVDISERKRDEEKQSTLSAIVESSDDAIVSKNLQGIITSWNNGAQRIFGYNEKEIIGKHITILIPADLQAEEETIISSIKAGKKIDHFRTIRIAKDGHKIHVSITVSPVKDSYGKIIGASKIARDITEQVHRENDINQANLRLQILNATSREISGRLKEGDILQKITDATTEITGASFGAFFYSTVDEEGESFILYALSGAQKEAFEKSGLPRNTAVFNATFSGETVVRVDDINKDPRYINYQFNYDTPEEHLPLLSYLSVPVTTATGDVLGGLFFGHTQAGMFKAEHENIIVSIAAQASVALENAKLFEEVKALNAKKDEFIALASHELKTPLTILKGYLQLLETDEVDPMKKLFLGKSVNQANKLNTLVSDLFDISRIEAGKLQLIYEEFDFRSLVAELIETFQYTNQSHQIIFTDPGEDFIIRADKQRMEQVVANLLGNAIKYSPGADKVYLNMCVDKGNLMVKIRDEGIGISEIHQKDIFTRFYRASDTVHVTGLGLGLYLSKEIIDRHEGDIFVSSEPGKGSEFCFSIPVNKKSS